MLGARGLTTEAGAEARTPVTASSNGVLGDLNRMKGCESRADSRRMCAGARNVLGPEARRVRASTVVDGGDEARASVEGGPKAAERTPSTWVAIQSTAVRTPV